MAHSFTPICRKFIKKADFSYDDVFGDLPEALSLKDAAEYLEVAEITVRRWTKEGKVSATRIGRNYAFNVKDLRAFKKSNV